MIVRSFVLLALVSGCASNIAPHPVGTGGGGVGSGVSGVAGGGGSTGAAGGGMGAAGADGGGGNIAGSGGEGAAGRGGNSAAGSGGDTVAGSGGHGAAGRGGNSAAGTGGSEGAAGASGAGGSTGEVPLDPALLSRCTGTNPIRCTIPVATDGNYTVTVSLGNATAASVARVQAELYRIVVPELSLGTGQLSAHTFSVNVRQETHDGYSAPGMTLDVLVDAPTTGPAPRLGGIGVASAPSLPTIFVAGDSTVCDWDPALATILSPIERGWAQELSQYLTARIAVANYADSGETAGSFYTKFFPQARAAMRAGDYLFIQFGHNDQKSQTDIDNYKANLTKYITDARAKNVTPVLFTPVARKGASTASPGFAGLDQQARDLAAAQNVALVDLTTLSLAYYKTVPDLSTLFATASEGTHFGESGATQIAAVVAQTLKAGTLPLRAFVR